MIGQFVVGCLVLLELVILYLELFIIELCRAYTSLVTISLYFVGHTPYTGWERRASREDGALFLHNPSTGESVWYTGWIELTSRWYGRKYWFQPTTGRTEWELPADHESAGSGEPSGRASGRPFDQSDAPTPSSDKVRSWKEKIKAAKAKSAGDAGGADGDSRNPQKRKREAGGGNASSDDMDVDDDVGGSEDGLAIGLRVSSRQEDVPSVALRRETLRRECLETFAEANSKIGKMTGYSKTSRSCRDEGMVVGLAGMFGRCAQRVVCK